MVHTCLKPYCSFVSFNLLILSLPRRSVIDIFLPFKTVLLKKMLCLSTYRTNVTIMSLDFPLSPFFKTNFLFYSSDQSVLSSHQYLYRNQPIIIFVFIFTNIINQNTISPQVSLFLSSFISKFSNFLWGAETCPHNSLMSSSFFRVFTSYSSNVSKIKSELHLSMFKLPNAFNLTVIISVC